MNATTNTNTDRVFKMCNAMNRKELGMAVSMALVNEQLDELHKVNAEVTEQLVVANAQLKEIAQKEWTRQMRQVFKAQQRRCFNQQQQRRRR